MAKAPAGEPPKAEDKGFDISQFADVFFEEASEHLAIMESLLIAAGDATPSDEDLGAIFRAAHSIKGGAAMFGMQDVTELTHDLESVLDDVRMHTLELTPDMVDAFLRSRDLTAQLLAQHKAGQPGGADDARVCELREQLRAFKRADKQAPTTEKPKKKSKQPAAKKAKSDDADAALARVVSQVVEEKPAAEEDLALVLEHATEARTPATGEAAEGVLEEGVGFGLFAPIKDRSFQPQPAVSNVKQAPTETTPTPAPAPAPKMAAPSANAASAESSSIRVAIEKVDQLINLVGELVITQAMLQQRAEGLDPLAVNKLNGALADLERNTRAIQEAVMSVRMLPMSMVFNRFPRMVRDLAAKLGKKVELKVSGEGTEVDKGMIEKIVDPLTHLIRNSMDHGIEMPDKRLAAGKPAQGTLGLAAYQQGGSIVIEVSDDGAGLNRERIVAKARERGMAVPDSITDGDVWQLIFEAGFSTAAEITDVSGRGVGMDVVKRNILSLGGTIEIESQAGRGSKMRIRLPLTLAIMDGMSVAVGDETYILPLASIIESLQVSPSSLRSVAGAGRVAEVRSEYLPVVSLREAFGITPGVNNNSDAMTVIVEADGVKTALLVDDLLGQHQVVVKSLEHNYKKVPGIASATILGDGRVAFIVDVPDLVRKARPTAQSLPLAATT